MRTNAWITLFLSLGAASLACYTDRPIFVVTSPDAAVPSAPGGAGTTGAAGSNGGADTTGTAGVGSAPQGCANISRVFMDHVCSLAGACHDANGAGGAFDMATTGWERRLAGALPRGGGNSVCGGIGMPYLVPGSVPARGLFLDKLKDKNPVCGDFMPSLPPVLTADELDCVQRWANGLTVVLWSGAPASLVGDGRLVDPSTATQGFGWDTCFAKPGLTRGPTSVGPRLGDTYLASGSYDPSDTSVAQTPVQASFWWDLATPVQGVWFDLALVSGTAAGSTITFYETDEGCDVQRTIGSYAVGEGVLQSQGQWRTGCVDLNDRGKLGGLGVRIDSPKGVIGLDALRFAESCH